MEREAASNKSGKKVRSPHLTSTDGGGENVISKSLPATYVMSEMYFHGNKIHGQFGFRTFL